MSNPRLFGKVLAAIQKKGAIEHAEELLANHLLEVEKIMKDSGNSEAEIEAEKARVAEETRKLYMQELTTGIATHYLKLREEKKQKKLSQKNQPNPQR